ncbi:MAG: helix-turn-helix transcriptional regulator [Gammaproteobacteria bacterium]|nr:helix-turn-helix transcriptional regulator [Gammaproteobacteria bacterium]
MNIDANRLHTLRTQRKLSREQLQQKSGVSARQIARFENEPESSARVRETTLTRLANALDIEMGVLTGKLPMPAARPLAEDDEYDTPSEDGYLRVRVNLLPSSQLAYELVERRYGVDRAAICNSGPLLFTLLAEASLAWRRKKLDEIEAVARQLEDAGKSSRHLRFASAAADSLLEDENSERYSIDNHDVFGKDLPPDAAPFADFLREFASEFDKEVIEVRKALNVWDEALENFPRYRLCKDLIRQLTGGRLRAVLALRDGHVRLRDIPQELWAEGATERSAQWLEEKNPPDNEVEELHLDMWSRGSSEND